MNHLLLIPGMYIASISLEDCLPRWFKRITAGIRTVQLKVIT